MNKAIQAILSEAREIGLPHINKRDVLIDVEEIREKRIQRFGYILRERGTLLLHLAHNAMEAQQLEHAVEFYQNSGEVCLFYFFDGSDLVATSPEKLILKLSQMLCVAAA